MMWPGPSLSDELVADPAREGQVGDRSMQVPEFSSTNAKFDAAELEVKGTHVTRTSVNGWPARNGRGD